MNLKALEEMEPEVIRLINGDNVNHVEFLNTKANYMLQVLPEHAGDDPESGLVRVPDGADTVTKCHDEIICWMNHYFSWCIGLDREWVDSKTYPDDYLNISEYLDENDGAKIVWQRNTLQQKVNEVRQHIGLTSNDKLSVMIGREKSYLRKLLKRKASSATVEKVIAELDALIVVRPTIDITSDGEIDAESCQTIGDHNKGFIDLEGRKTTGNSTAACGTGASQSDLKSTNDLLKELADSMLVSLLKRENSKLKREIDSQLNVFKVSDSNVEFWRERHNKLQSQFNWMVVFASSIAFSCAILAYKLWI